MTDYQFHLLNFAYQASKMQPVDEPLLLESIGATAALGLLGATQLRTETLPQIVHARLYQAEHGLVDHCPDFAAVYELPEGRELNGGRFVFFAIYPPEQGTSDPAQCLLEVFPTELQAKRYLVSCMLENLQVHWSDEHPEYWRLQFEDYLEDILNLDLPFRCQERFTSWEKILDDRANDRAHWD